MARSLVGAVVGKKRRFERALLEIMGVKRLRSVSLNNMNACKLSFPDNSFDGVFSFSVFEHIDDPLQALREVERVLRPRGIFYLDIPLFTSIHGDHDFRYNIRPWNRLRLTDSYYEPPHYVNGMRLVEWKEMLGKTFNNFTCPILDGEWDVNSRYLTDEIRKELAKYSEEELLTTTFMYTFAFL